MVRVYISPHADVSTRAVPGEVLALPWHLLLCFAAAGGLHSRSSHGCPSLFFCAEMVRHESDVVDAFVTHWGTTDDKTCYVLLCSGKAYWYYWMWTEYIRILIIQQAVELCFWTGARLSLPSRASEGVHATGNHRGPCSFGLLGSNGSTLSAIADGKEKSTPTGPNDGWNMVKHIKWQEPP